MLLLHAEVEPYIPLLTKILCYLDIHALYTLFSKKGIWRIYAVITRNMSLLFLNDVQREVHISSSANTWQRIANQHIQNSHAPYIRT